MDCGSGQEFVFPHLAAADREGPNKILDNASTVPMKVCNGLIHGDTRSHVILSPGVVGATANHTIDCLTIMINTVLQEHGTMPPEFALQFDGASTNKNILVLTYLALYVLFGVFRRARARCELEHHAHDIYDAVHAVHAGQVRRSTFFHLEELIGVVEAAHSVAKDKSELNPIAGHDVKVSCLWQARDFWEWLSPGYTDPKTREHALKNAAFSSFSSFRGYRDFLLEREKESTPDNPRVGLWAKAYMTSPEHEYLGTIITMESYVAVTRDRSPNLQHRDVGACKTAREAEILKKYKAATSGQYRKQFPPERLADATAMASRNWAHFSGRKGELEPWALWLPHELAQELRRRGLRHGSEVHEVHGAQSSKSLQSAEFITEHEEAQLMATLDPDKLPPALKQRRHGATELFGFKRGDRIQELKTTSRAPSDVDFQTRLVVPGSFVISRPALSSHWAKSSPKLKQLDFWLWRVVRVYRPGEALPGMSKPAGEFTYLAHLFHTKNNLDTEGPWEQTWDVVGPQYMRTDDEKKKREEKKTAKEKVEFARRLQRLLPHKKILARLAIHKSKKSKPKKSKAEKSSAQAASSSSQAAQQEDNPEDEEKPVALPLQCFLRPGNIIGGSFNRTGTGKLPRFVICYWQRHVQAAGD